MPLNRFDNKTVQCYRYKYIKPLETLNGHDFSRGQNNKDKTVKIEQTELRSAPQIHHQPEVHKTPPSASFQEDSYTEKCQGKKSVRR